MAILYEFQMVEPVIDPQSNNVIAWAIGLRGTDTDDPACTAYVDAEVPVPEAEQKPLSEWTEDEIRSFAMEHAIKEEYTASETGEKEYSEKNWFNQIKQQVEAMRGQPIRGSHIVI